MPKRTRSYESDLHERLRDPAYAVEYLKAALQDVEEENEAVFLLALRDVAKANRMAYVADATGLNRESLYKMLSEIGNPSLSSLKAILSALGMRLSVELAFDDLANALKTFSYSECPTSFEPSLRIDSWTNAVTETLRGQNGCIQHVASVNVHSQVVRGSAQSLLNFDPTVPRTLDAGESGGGRLPLSRESQFAYVA